MLSCKIGNTITNTFEKDDNYFRDCSSRGILKCPKCGGELQYNHGIEKRAYFSHKNLKDSNCNYDEELMGGKYDPSTIEEHSEGIQFLYKLLKQNNNIKNIQLEKSIKETKQRADIYFEHEDIKYVIEYQCTPIGKEYQLRHDLYRKNNIKDIWILGNNKIFKNRVVGEFNIQQIEKLVMKDYGFIYYITKEEIKLLKGEDVELMYNKQGKSYIKQFYATNIYTCSIEDIILEYQKEDLEFYKYNLISISLGEGESFKKIGQEIIGVKSGLKFSASMSIQEINKKIRKIKSKDKYREEYFKSEEFAEIYSFIINHQVKDTYIEINRVPFTETIVVNYIDKKYGNKNLTQEFILYIENPVEDNIELIRKGIESLQSEAKVTMLNSEIAFSNYTILKEELEKYRDKNIKINIDEYKEKDINMDKDNYINISIALNISLSNVNFKYEINKEINIYNCFDINNIKSKIENEISVKEEIEDFINKGYIIDYKNNKDKSDKIYVKKGEYYIEIDEEEYDFDKETIINNLLGTLEEHEENNEYFSKILQCEEYNKLENKLYNIDENTMIEKDLDRNILKIIFNHSEFIYKEDDFCNTLFMFHLEEDISKKYCKQYFLNKKCEYDAKKQIITNNNDIYNITLPCSIYNFKEQYEKFTIIDNIINDDYGTVLLSKLYSHYNNNVEDVYAVFTNNYVGIVVNYDISINIILENKETIALSSDYESIKTLSCKIELDKNIDKLFKKLINNNIADMIRKIKFDK